MFVYVFGIWIGQWRSSLIKMQINLYATRIFLFDYFCCRKSWKKHYMHYSVRLSFSTAVNCNSAIAAAGNGCPLLPSNSSLPLLSVTPRVSGLERSQERSMEQPEPFSTSSSLPGLAAHSTASVSNSLPEQRNGNGRLYHRHDPSPPQHKHKPFPFPGKSQSIYSNNRSV